MTLRERLFGEPKRENRRLDWQMTPLADLLWAQELVLDWPAARRCRVALWWNVAVPGAGLIALQRERAGLVLAGAFAVPAWLALMGLLVVPALVPFWLVVTTAVGAGIAWLTAQAFLMDRIYQLQDETRRLHAAVRIEQAREAVMTGQWAQAKRFLDEAASYDAEQPDLNWLLARFHTATSRSDVAAAQWRRLRQVDRAGRYEPEVREALAARTSEDEQVVAA